MSAPYNAPPQSTVTPHWLWIILLLIAIGVAAYYFMKK